MVTMQGEIRGAPGVRDSKLALIGGVSNRQVKPEERRGKNEFIAPKKRSSASRVRVVQ